MYDQVGNDIDLGREEVFYLSILEGEATHDDCVAISICACESLG